MFQSILPLDDIIINALDISISTLVSKLVFDLYTWPFNPKVQVHHFGGWSSYYAMVTI